MHKSTGSRDWPSSQAIGPMPNRWHPTRTAPLGDVPPLTSPPAFGARKWVRAVIPNEGHSTASDQSRHSSAPGRGKNLLSLHVNSGHPHDAQRPAIRVSLTGHPSCRATDWTTAGHGWQGKETTLRLVGWSRQRRVILLRRKLDRPLVLVDRTEPEQPLLGFAEIGPDREVWEYAALVTSLDSEIVTLGQLYRDRD